MSNAKTKKATGKAEKRVIGRPFQKGKPGGPGRPKGKSLRSMALGYLGQYVHEDPNYLKDWFRGFFERAKTPGKSDYGMLASMILSPDMFDRYDSWVDRGERQEQAFLSYQIHKMSTDIQRTILFSRAKYLFLMAGRRGGKSQGVSHWYGDEFVQKPDAQCLYIGLTITRAMELLWQPMLDLFAELGIKVKEHSRIEGRILTEAGGLLRFGGNGSKDEREKNRGAHWDRVAIDECQSQKELMYLVESIISPTLLDTGGQLALAGTGPRVRGTYWEAVFLGQWADGRSLYPDALRLNWNLTQNPFIPNYEKALEEIRREKQLKETDSLYVREYLGRISYDDDALVLRLGDGNAFVDDELAAWIAHQPVTDIRFTSGLDFGFTDSDAFVIIAYSTSRPERWIVYEYKKNRIGTAELAVEIRAGIQYVQTSPLFAKVVTREFMIYADTGGNAITPYDLATQYGLPIQAAYKAEKAMAVELLQDEVRRGLLKARRDGAFWDESLKTIYRRDEQDKLTREIDDETFHPDMIPAVTYGMRDIWLFNTKGGKA
jgi:hypothetical protein